MVTHFPLRNGHQSITLVCEIISVRRREYLPSQNENIFTFQLVQMFGAATNINKFCIATSGPVFASGEHVAGGLTLSKEKNQTQDGDILLCKQADIS